MNRKHNESEPHYAARMWAICVGLPCLALCIIGILATVAEAAPVRGDHECFSAKQWGPAPDAVRPCATVAPNRPEAGAVAFRVSDADGTVRYSGFVNTPFAHVFHVWIVKLYEDGSFCWMAINWTGTPTHACVGNLED